MDEYAYKKEYEGATVSIFRPGYPGQIGLSVLTSQEHLKLLFDMGHEAVVKVKKEPKK
jgi:metal-dependent hydrolase (beta-lactamase superfamily II)